MKIAPVFYTRKLHDAKVYIHIYVKAQFTVKIVFRTNVSLTSYNRADLFSLELFVFSPEGTSLFPRILSIILRAFEPG